MDFFARQNQARQRTRLLVALFLAAIVGIIAVLYGVAIFLNGPPWWQPELLGGIAILVFIVVGCGSLFKISQLAEGGAAVATLLGGVPVDPQTKTPRLRQLLNVVEEMALASGVPVPGVYVLPEDASINAFAAGHSVADAVVGVTQGTLEQLSRDELQGVIAHEFSHILNGDMRLNIRLMGLLFGILCLALLGQLLFRVALVSRPRSSDKNSGGFIALALGAGLALLIVGYIGVFFARIIQSAVSRQREFLADSAAVQFTRNPLGIAGALYKIGESSSRVSSPHASEASHLFFGNGVRSAWFGLFATHPPIPERIRAIAPDFHPDALSPAKEASPPPLPKTPEARISSGQSSGWFGQAGAPDALHLAQAAALLASLPANTTAAVHELHGATALVMALLLDSDTFLRERQLAALALDEATLQEVQAYFSQRDHLTYEQEIALIDLAIATLRHLSPEQYRTFRAQVEALIGMDGKVDLFEFLLEKILVRHLDGYFQPKTAATVRYHSLQPLLPDVATLLGSLAALADIPKADAPPQDRKAGEFEAFQAGVQALSLSAKDPALTLPEAVNLEQVGVALDHIGQAAPAIKRQILEACGAVVLADGHIADRQGQLLRAIADAVDCPVPLLAQINH